MNEERDTKANRILYMYHNLRNGEIINKKEVAFLFNVNEKSIQRDLDDIRSYLCNNIQTLGENAIKYDRKKKGYSLQCKDSENLTKEDILAISKILLESRAFCIDELDHLLKALLGQVDRKQSTYIKEIIGDENFNYVPLMHEKSLLKVLWDLSEFIRFRKTIEIKYVKVNQIEVKRTINPLAIIFSEYYFYLIANIDGSDFHMPAVYRVDRIEDYIDTEMRFRIPYEKRFKEGEFRKRIQFMYPGKLMKIKFEFYGKSINAVLERLPTAEIISKEDGKYLIEAEVFGKGIIMWILSQGSKIKVLEPKELLDEIKKEVIEIKNNYCL